MTKQIDHLKKSAAEKARTVLGIDWDKLSPIDPFSIAKKNGIKVLFSNLPQSISGSIERDSDGNVTIYISNREPKLRQKFTCAHELGHFFQQEYKANRKKTLRNNDTYLFVENREQKQDISEIFADEFAGNLLMPEAMIIAILKRKPSSVVEIANKLEMSIQATSIRLSKLGYSL